MIEEKSDVTGSASNTHVWYVDVAVCAGALQSWQDRAGALDVATRARLDQIKNDNERKTRFTVHSALRVLIEHTKGPSWRNKPLVYSSAGKPSMPGLGQSLSLSHTKGVGLIALSPSPTVGVDIEARHRCIKMQPERQQAIISAAGAVSQMSAQQQTQLSFISAWVRLEACAKATGRGLAPLLTEAMAPLRQNGAQILAKETEGLADKLSVYELEVAPGFVAAIALGKAQSAPEVHRFPGAALELAKLLATR